MGIVLKKRWSNLVAQINFRVLYTVLSALIIIAGTVLAIQYAKGNYRFTQQGYVSTAGLLNANSFPTAAEVFIDGKLVTATDNTLYLEPNNYLIEIKKDGYSSWKKTLHLEPQLVAQTNAQLFPIAPSLSPLTFTGVDRVIPSPDGQKILYTVASASSQTKVGLHIIELSNGPGSLIGMQKSPKLIADGISATDLATANFIWSPDSAEVLVSAAGGDWLLSIDKKVTISEQPDIGWKKKTILSEWEQEMYVREKQFLTKFPAEILQIATQSAKNVYLSPDKKRLMYTATASASLPENIIPALPASNTQPQARTLTPGKIYVYDKEEDKNFEIATALVNPSQPPAEKRLLTLHSVPEIQASNSGQSASPSAFQALQATNSAQTALNFNVYHSSLYINTLQWFPDSRHVLFIRDNRIEVMEYDGTNLTTLYSGPFANSFTYPWPDGSRLLILTAFSPDSPQNLYAIELK
jgi:hypothetical protein